MMNELKDLIKDMEKGSQLDAQRVVDLKGIILNIIWAMVTRRFIKFSRLMTVPNFI